MQAGVDSNLIFARTVQNPNSNWTMRIPVLLLTIFFVMLPLYDGVRSILNFFFPEFVNLGCPLLELSKT